MERNIFELIQAKKHPQELATLITINHKSEHFGLTLTEKQAEELIICRNNTLKKYQRVEFGNGILDTLIFTFCDSQYLNQDNYLETLMRLQEIFYLYKNETNDKLTDQELLTFMKEQFESVCYGDIDYLENTCLTRFAAAIRNGYDGYIESEGHHEYENVDEEERWDNNLYMDVIKELFW